MAKMEGVDSKNPARDKFLAHRGSFMSHLSVQRPLGVGRSFKFFKSLRKSYIFGGDIADVGVNTDGTWATSDDQYNTLRLPLQFDGDNFISMLFDDEPTTAANTKTQFAKFPEMFKYLSCVPVYYAIRMTIVRAYIQLDTGNAAGMNPTTSDIQFAQNLAQGQQIDFFYYYDTQNFNHVINFADTPERFSNMLDNRKFHHGRHVPGDVCSINGKAMLPKITTLSTVYPYPTPDNTHSAGTAIRNFLSNNTSESIKSLGCPGSLFWSPVIPLSSALFKQYFNTPTSATTPLARLCVDVNYTTKMILNCSNNLGYMVPWQLPGGKIPHDLA